MSVARGIEYTWPDLRAMVLPHPANAAKARWIPLNSHSILIQHIPRLLLNHGQLCFTGNNGYFG